MSTEEKYNSHRDINNRKHKKNNGNKLKKMKVLNNSNPILPEVAIPYTAIAGSPSNTSLTNRNIFEGRFLSCYAIISPPGVIQVPMECHLFMRQLVISILSEFCFQVFWEQLTSGVKFDVCCCFFL